MAAVQLSGIFKRYGDTQVVHGIDLHIDDGEFVVLVGPSGCGKSTLMRMVAGLEEISGGELLIGGTRANGLAPQQRNVSMVFQSYALYPHLSVYDNIAFGPRIRKESTSHYKPRIEAAAKMLNLSGYLDRLPRALSGGQRQRVAMGRAVVREPSLFLFDEPLSNLDAKLRVQMRTEIKGAASTAEKHGDLRHARPDRSDDDGRSHRRDERGPHRADRATARSVRPSGESVCREFSGVAVDELCRRRSGRRRAGPGTCAG